MYSKSALWSIVGLCLVWATMAVAAPPALPVIPAKSFDVTQYGAVGDGKTRNTAALQKAIDTAAAAGGGTVLIPAGKFLTGPFGIASRINLKIAAGAFILISDDIANYPATGGRFQDCISATDAHDVRD